MSSTNPYRLSILTSSENEQLIDSINECICSTFGAPLPDEELHRLGKITDPFVRRAGLYESLKKHLPADQRHKRLWELGSGPTVLGCGTKTILRPIIKPYVVSSAQSG